MATANINDIRRDNIKRLVTKYEGANALARALGLTKGAYIYQVLREPGTPHARRMSADTARKWEKTLGLPEGWLDGASGNAGALKVQLLAEVLTRVLDSVQAAGLKIPSAKIAELVTMQYVDSLESGKVDGTRIDALVRLLR